jgi:hypothetical protein
VLMIPAPASAAGSLATGTVNVMFGSSRSPQGRAAVKETI